MTNETMMAVEGEVNARADGCVKLTPHSHHLFLGDTRMTSRQIKALAIGAVFSLFLISAAQAQPASDQATTTEGSANASKQAQKAQKKADRKARREKKNAELSKLEKNGYNPSGDQLRYPQNVQNAEKKANPQGAGVAGPSSAP
jgi:hypothetical protein